jgi:hypothetical protein
MQRRRLPGIPELDSESERERKRERRKKGERGSTKT